MKFGEFNAVSSVLPPSRRGDPRGPVMAQRLPVFLLLLFPKLAKPMLTVSVSTQGEMTSRIPASLEAFGFVCPPAIVLVTESAFCRNCLSLVHRFGWGWLASRPREAARSRGNLLSGPQSLILGWAHGPLGSFKATLGATAELLGTLDFLIVRRIKTSPASGHLVTLWRKHLEETRQECFLFWI